jgi:hypothetical protein
MLMASSMSAADSTFVVTGTEIPANLLQQSYGKMPKGIGAYDLSICNVTETKQSVVSSEIYQALSQSTGTLRPIGRQTMLSYILRAQSHSPTSIVMVALNSLSGVLSILSSSRYGVPAGVVSGAALGAVSAQQVITSLKPLVTADQLEKFETQVLEPALVLDAGSCVERTVFTTTPFPKAQAASLRFHVR